MTGYADWKEAMELYLIRHAQSQNNERPQEQRVEDPALTELGHVQAARLGRWIRSLRLTRLVTSPFLRTLQTAEHLARSTDLVPDVWIDLHELGGCVSGSAPEVMLGRPGLTGREIATQFPTFRIVDPIDGQGWWQSKPYESSEQAAQRARMLLERTRTQFAGSQERVAYVTHGDFKRIFLELFHVEPLGVPFNSSVTKVLLAADSIHLQAYNLVEHLPAHWLSH
jgi:2,3-bisphosphoglycerate-dependent phosphoglycerate mutase